VAADRVEEALCEMAEDRMPDLPAQRVSLGESGNAAPASLPWGGRAGFSVKFHRGIALLMIASVLLWGGLFSLLWLLWD
jgi:hypothetical protein